MTTRSAVLVGATGLVGGHCLSRLLDDGTYDRVVVLARRPLGRAHPKLVEHVVDFDRIAEVHPDLRADDAYCCLGTTIKVAGSQAAFRRVDHEYTVAVAKLAREAGARRVALVSSVGADPGSTNFYLRVKGETERDVAALGFETAEIFRPSFLMGDRRESRPGEAVGIAISRVVSGAMLGPLKAYRPVEAADVAAAMVAALRRGEPGTRVRTYGDIAALARGAA